MITLIHSTYSKWIEPLPTNLSLSEYVGLHSYSFGYDKPNYPLPAIRGWNIDPPHGGGVQDDFVMIGATIVDWSRGSIEVY